MNFRRKKYQIISRMSLCTIKSYFSLTNLELIKVLLRDAKVILTLLYIYISYRIFLSQLLTHDYFSIIFMK